jgi:RecJ-like exonuclease
MSRTTGHQENVDVVTRQSASTSCPECGAQFICVPCRSCQGTGRLLFFFNCRNCAGAGEKMLCPNFLFHSRTRSTAKVVEREGADKSATNSRNFHQQGPNTPHSTRPA